MPKIHAFFSQGGGIKSCISPKAPHLNDVGEVICPDCSKENKTRITFPLVFCRACGQEYYSVSIGSDGTLRPRDMDDLDVEGEPAYIFVGKYDPEATPPPDQWQTPTGAIRKERREFVELEEAEYCPTPSSSAPQTAAESSTIEDPESSTSFSPLELWAGPPQLTFWFPTT